MSNIKAFLIALCVNFVVLAILSILFEFFDKGDDPIYDAKEALKNLILAIVISAILIWQLNMRKSDSSNGNS